MADSNLPSWFLWFGGGTSALAAWAGLVLSIRRELIQRPELKFVFEVTSHLLCEDEHEREYSTNAIKVTITNIRSQPIALDRVFFVLQSASDGSLKSKNLPLGGAKVVHGEPASGWLELYKIPKSIKSVTAVDTTGKKWNPNATELAQLLAACTNEWPTKQQTNRDAT